jgi:hypothetical protein
MLTPYIILRDRILSTLRPVIITTANIQGNTCNLFVTLTGAEEFTITATLDSVPVTLTTTSQFVRSFEFTASGSTQLVEWTVEATNTAGTESVSEEFTIPATLVAPTFTNTSSSVSGRTLTVSVTPNGTPTPALTVALTVDGGPETMTLASPGVWTYEFDASASTINYSGTVTGINGQSPNATYNFSGALAPTLTVPADFNNGNWFLTNVNTVPSIFEPTDWSVSFTQPVATVPDIFSTTNWSVSVDPDDVLPPPSGTLTEPRSVVATKLNDQEVRVTWLAPLSGTVSRYDAEWSYRGANVWTPTTGVVSPLTLGRLPRGAQEYDIRIIARDTSGGSTVSAVARATTDWRPYGIDADWNQPISRILSRGSHINETYFRDVLWQGSQGNTGSNAGRPLGTNYVNFFDRSYTYPVYLSREATTTALVQAGAGNWNGQRVPWNPSWTIPGGTDQQIIILDESTGVEYNAWQVSYSPSLNRLTASRFSRVTANFDETGGPGDYRTKTDGFRPSRGCGVQYLAMLITPEEIEQGKIYHAVSCVMGRSGHKFFTRPAYKGERFAGNEHDQGIPQGTRFYFDVSDQEITNYVNSWPSAVPSTTRNTMRIVFQAMRDYGCIASDQGGGNHIQFQHDASTDWSQYGLTFTGNNTDDGNLVVNGRAYPRDAIDNYISDKSRIKFLNPPDGILHRAEWQSDTPFAPRALTGNFTTSSGQSINMTDIGEPAITGSASTGSVLSISRRGQFIGEHPVTVNWYWQYNSVDTGALNQLTFTKPGPLPARVRFFASNNRGTSASQFSNAI